MVIKIGCFALINPFQTLDKQLQQINAWGIQYADVTDNTDGACLGAEYGFTSVASLDANPFDIKRLFESHGITITSVCAHANLLDPTAPWRYGSSQLIKAVKLAATMGVKHVITAEGEPHTVFGKNLDRNKAIFSITEKLFEPIRLAEDLGVKILLEPHGHITGSVENMGLLIDSCDSKAIGINLDTGNLWLGGGDSLEMIDKLGSKIEHVHWKDMPEEMASRRGQLFGCGMSTISLGSGIVGIEDIYKKLVSSGFSGYTTLEVAGEEAVLQSCEYLASLEKKVSN